MAIQDVCKAINDGTGPCSARDFLVMFAELIADHMGAIIADLDDSVDEIEDTVLTAESHELRSKLELILEHITILNEVRILSIYPRSKNYHSPQFHNRDI